MQQQNYEAALPIFKKLTEENPTEYYFFERYIECFIQLKKYNEGLEAISDLKPLPNFKAQANVLEAQLHHFKGDTTRAFQTWDNNLKSNPRNLQIYISTANSMSELNEFDKAVAVLRSARVTFNNPQLFYNDISSTLLQANKYEEAIAEWIAWLIAQPDQVTNIQRVLLRFDDPFLNDIAILEIDDKLNEIPIQNPAYSTLFRFQIWLLQENELYRRALASAMAFENSTSNFNYSLFQLGRSLRRNKEYELAAEAFQYYISEAEGNVKWQSQEELAKVYTQWAKQLEDFNLDFANQKDTLFSKSLEQLNLIIDQAPNYRNISRVLLLKSEIVLDYSQNITEAKNILARLQNLNKEIETPEEYYIQGRIQISEQEYTQARISFTKSNKLADIGELAEKTRYFLALTDFFSSDYEFAVIQLKTLGRQNTSYYANDALELRLWIQEGLNADSTGATLDTFADVYFETLLGNYDSAKNKFVAFLDEKENNPLYDDALLKFSALKLATPQDRYQLINKFLSENPFSPNKERLLWELATTSEKLYQIHSENNSSTPEEDFLNSGNFKNPSSIYEDLILTYPQGFYAPYARKRLTELSKKNI